MYSRHIHIAALITTRIQAPKHFGDLRTRRQVRSQRSSQAVRRNKAAPGSTCGPAQYFPGPLFVFSHLRNERLGRSKFRLGANPFNEMHLDQLAIKAAGKVKKKSFE